MPEITAREWRWLAVASMAVLIVFSIPYLIGWLNATPQNHFSGFLIALEDMYSYIAKMRYGARDGWDFHLVYTSEPHSGGYVFLPFLALGKLTALVTGQGASVSADALITAFHIARIVCGAVLLVVIYVFVARFLAVPWQRRAAWTIAAVGGGFGWLQIFVLTFSEAPHLPPAEFYIPEAFTPIILMSLPHLALARALLLAGWLALIAAAESRRPRLAALAGVLWLGVSLCVPFDVGLLAGVSAVWLAALWIARRKLPIYEACLALAAGILPGLYAVYNVWLFTTNPIFAIWSSQNLLPSPPLFEYGIAYGLLAALGIIGAIPLIRGGLDHRTSLLVTWPGAALIMAYLPINVQRRLLEGMIVPLAILAALGLARLWNSKLALRRPARLGVVGLASILGLSSLFLLLGETVSAQSTDTTVFHPADEVSALEWLAGHAPPDSVVFSTHRSGMMLPAYAPVRVYVGHGPETVHSVEKTALARSFFGGGMDDTARAVLLRNNAVRYVWIGAAERSLACTAADCFDARRLGLVEVFRAGSFSIDEVAP